MNSTAPIPAVGTTNVAPTAGALLGSTAGLIVAGKLGLNPFDPASGGAVVATVATLLTSLFHWLGKKTGVPGLG
jgi:hypothetical protein